MTKEEFTYELIDKWLYLISQQCVLMENYTQRDRTSTYEKCSEQLEKCFDYYDQLYKKVDLTMHSEEEIDAKLGMLIQKLKNETVNNIIKDIQNELCMDNNTKTDLINKHLLSEQRRQSQEIKKHALINFVEELRTQEEKMWDRR